MRSEPLDCAEVRRRFVAGHVPSGTELAEHLAVCPECRELFADEAELGRRLGEAGLPEVEPGELFGLIEREVARDVGPRAALRALRTRTRVGILALVGGLLFASQLLWRPRPNLGTYSPLVFWLAASMLGAALAFGALRLLRGPSAPLGAVALERLLGVVLLVVPALAALLAPLGSAEAAALWGEPSRCFVYGASLTAPVVLLYWLFERRDQPPVSSLVAAGALGGLSANLLLHAHCPSAHPGHLLLGHVSIGLVWAAALWLLLKPARLAR
jgi:multisubunit Na+/H+ antiporter MnhF subunit